MSKCIYMFYISLIIFAASVIITASGPDFLDYVLIVRKEKKKEDQEQDDCELFESYSL